MSNTLKFGNGQFATKKGSTLAYNDENGNFKPLPFTFDRDTYATRVNKEGLIEVVSNNEPRIDFLNDSKGALKLEPLRSNLFTYSEEFDNGAWSKTRSSIDANQIISPSGILNADKFIENTDNNSHLLSRITFVTAQDYVSSVFIKKGERKKVRLRFDNTLTLRYAEFDLENGIVDLESNSIASIEDYGNGWYRCSIKVTATATIFYSVIQLLSDNGDLSYQGDGTSGVYLWGAQLEQGSYATSYIPTQGSIGTRVAETCEQTLPSGIIGQTEGVIYVEAKDVADDGSTKMITINDGGQTNEIRIDFRTLNQIQLVFTVGGSPQAVISTSSYNSLEFNKIAFKYKENDFALWVNGVKVGVDTNGSTNATNVFSVLEFKRGSGLFPFYGSTKNVKLYNTALTDQELKDLTKI